MNQGRSSSAEPPGFNYHTLRKHSFLTAWPQCVANSPLWRSIMFGFTLGHWRLAEPYTLPALAAPPLLPGEKDPSLEGEPLPHWLGPQVPDLPQTPLCPEPGKVDGHSHLKGSLLFLWVSYTQLGVTVVIIRQVGVTLLILLQGQLYFLQCVCVNAPLHLPPAGHTAHLSRLHPGLGPGQAEGLHSLSQLGLSLQLVGKGKRVRLSQWPQAQTWRRGCTDLPLPRATGTGQVARTGGRKGTGASGRGNHLSPGEQERQGGFLACSNMMSLEKFLGL